MDIADEAAKKQAEDIERALQAAKGAEMPGPARCMACSWANDRAQAGWATCSDCAVERVE